MLELFLVWAVGMRPDVEPSVAGILAEVPGVALLM